MPQEAKSQVTFKSPPVVETVIGVEFEPVEGWAVGHFGLFWERIRQEFPKHQALPPLSSQIERFDQSSPPSRPILEFTQAAPVRCWFFHRDDSRLLQLQENRLLLNWRKTSPQAEYPRFDTLKPEFKQHWQAFRLFLRDQDLPEPRVVQCELTYVDQIPKGQGWNSFADLAKVCTPWAGFRAPELAEPESVALNMRFRLPDERGRLHLVAQPAIRNDDGTEVLNVNVTARGAPNTTQLDDILNWFDLGHEWTVKVFLDFFTPELQNFWGRAK